MFDIGPLELLLIFVVALLVIGPERLPAAVKTASLWISRFRRSFNKIKAEVEKELNADEIRRQIHNESILADVEEAKAKAKKFSDEVKSVATREEVEEETDLGLEDSKSKTGESNDQTDDPELEKKAAARKASNEESKIARELGQAVSYVNDISRDVRETGKELASEFNPKKPAGKPVTDGEAKDSEGASKSDPVKNK